VFDVIEQTPQHKYQILTKRETILETYCNLRKMPDNVWLGVSVESAKTKHRIDVLRKISANIRFLSIEPLIADVGKIDLSGIHWVIVGGESGPKARPMRPEWALNVQSQCDQKGTAFFFKQWGTWGEDGVRRSKKANGRVLLGREWNEEPRLFA
jgi:protein gp37